MSPDESTHSRVISTEVDEASSGDRLDVFLGQALDDLSRTHAKRLIKEGRVRVNGVEQARPSSKVNDGDSVEIELPPPPPIGPEPEDIPLDIVYEDADLIIVNKPSGMVVHPSAGHENGTLVNAVLHHCRDIQIGALTSGIDDVSRPGIVHRLDRDTSGVMVVAKSPTAMMSLSRQAREHTFERRYRALVRGKFAEDKGVIRASIGRSLSDRGRMAVTGIKSREAVTHFAVLEQFGVAASIALQLETGRTHQIRVHLRFAGRPVLGDPVYGVTDYGSWDIPANVRAALEGLQGQALHAELLGIEHPRTGERMRFESPLPPDFQRALDALREFAAGS